MNLFKRVKNWRRAAKTGIEEKAYGDSWRTRGHSQREEREIKYKNKNEFEDEEEREGTQLFEPGISYWLKMKKEEGEGRGHCADLEPGTSKLKSKIKNRIKSENERWDGERFDDEEGS